VSRNVAIIFVSVGAGCLLEIEQERSRGRGGGGGGRLDFYRLFHSFSHKVFVLAVCISTSYHAIESLHNPRRGGGV